MIIIGPAVKLLFKIATLAIYAVTALCCYGGYISPAIFPITSVLVLALPYLVVFSVALILLWLCLRSWGIAATGVVILILCRTPIGMHFPFNYGKEPTPGAVSFTLLTWNVSHGDDFCKPDEPGNRTFETILAEDADIVCLQELINFNRIGIHHMTDELYDKICKKYPYRSNLDSYDVQIWSKYPFDRLMQSESRYFPNAKFARFNIKGNKFLLCNVHLTSYHLDEEEQKIISEIHSPQGIETSLKNFKNTVYNKLTSSFPIRAEVTENIIWNLDAYKGPEIVCGDFNDVPASWTYRLFINAGFSDAYNETNFFATDTFYNNFLFFHIDQIMYRGMIRPLSVDRIDIRSSDHYGLKAVFEFV